MSENTCPAGKEMKWFTQGGGNWDIYLHKDGTLCGEWCERRKAGRRTGFEGRLNWKGTCRGKDRRKPQEKPGPVGEEERFINRIEEWLPQSTLHGWQDGVPHRTVKRLLGIIRSLQAQAAHLHKALDAARPVMEDYINLIHCEKWIEEKDPCGECLGCQARAWMKEYFPEEE